MAELPDQQDSPKDPPDQPVVEDPMPQDPMPQDPMPEDPMPEDPEDPMPADPMPDPGDLLYARDILPIIEEHCAECHHEGRMPDLVTLPRDASLRELLADRIIARAEQSTMPPAPRDMMPAAELEKIKEWKANGVWP